MTYKIVLFMVALLFSSCAYKVTKQQAYPFKKAKVSSDYLGPYLNIPAYFKPALKEELKYRISDLSFTNVDPDISLDLDVLYITLEPIGITYFTNHPTANTYLLKMKVKSTIKTKDYENIKLLERSRTFATGLTSRSNMAAISKDYNFRATAEGLAQDISRELVNLFLARYNKSHATKLKED